MNAAFAAIVRPAVACALGACLVGGVGYAVAKRELLEWPAWSCALACLIGALCGACMGAVAANWLEAAELTALAAVLLACGVTDLARRIIPNHLVATAAALRGAYLCLDAWPGVGGVGNGYALEKAGTSLLGAVAVLLALVATRLVWMRAGDSPQQGLGGGDAKLLSVCGAYLGPIGGMACVALSCLLALACCAGAWLMGCVRGAGEPFPRVFSFAPQVLASMVTLTVFRAF